VIQNLMMLGFWLIYIRNDYKKVQQIKTGPNEIA